MSIQLIKSKLPEHRPPEERAGMAFDYGEVVYLYDSEGLTARWFTKDEWRTLMKEFEKLECQLARLQFMHEVSQEKQEEERHKEELRLGRLRAQAYRRRKNDAKKKDWKPMQPYKPRPLRRKKTPTPADGQVDE